MLTSEFCIAVHALVYLNHRATTLSSEELSQNICTNPAYVRKVMGKLKKANLVSTKEGLDGGYYFALDPQTVTLKMLSDALTMQAVSSNWHSGNLNAECQVSSGMAEVMDKLYQQLNNVCMDVLQQVTIHSISQQLFNRKHN